MGSGILKQKRVTVSDVKKVPVLDACGGRCVICDTLTLNVYMPKIYAPFRPKFGKWF